MRTTVQDERARANSSAKRRMIYDGNIAGSKTGARCNSLLKVKSTFETRSAENLFHVVAMFASKRAVNPHNPRRKSRKIIITVVRILLACLIEVVDAAWRGIFTISKCESRILRRGTWHTHE